MTPTPPILPELTSRLSDKSHDELVDLACEVEVKCTFPDGATTSDLLLLFRDGVGALVDLDRDLLLLQLAETYDSMIGNFDLTLDDFLSLEW